jgi:hypothetical protein
MGNCHADHVTSIHQQKLALKFAGQRRSSFSTVCLQTKSHGVCLFVKFTKKKLLDEKTTVCGTHEGEQRLSI